MIEREYVPPVPRDEDSRPRCTVCGTTGLRGVSSEQWHHDASECVASRSDAKELSANDATNLEKIAVLRGHIGKLRAHIMIAHDVMQHLCYDSATDGVRTILRRALELKVEGET